jgi:hypothetical protein
MKFVVVFRNVEVFEWRCNGSASFTRRAEFWRGERIVGAAM